MKPLRKMLPAGSTVYTLITHVARSGMSRNVRVLIARKGQIEDITGLIAGALGMRRATGANWDIVVGGCGFDAGFHVVSNLGYALFPKGGPLSKSTRQFQGKRNGETREMSGAYLLNHGRL